MKTTQVRYTWRGAETKQGYDRLWYARTRPMEVISYEKRGIWDWARQIFGVVEEKTIPPQTWLFETEEG